MLLHLDENFRPASMVTRNGNGHQPAPKSPNGHGEKLYNPSDPFNLAPHSTEAEEAVLGSIIMDPVQYHMVGTFLTDQDFFHLRHGWIFEAVKRLHDRGDALDTRTLAEELRQQERLDDIGGEMYLRYLPSTVPTALHAEVYGRIVERAALRRRMLGAAGRIAQLAHDESNNALEALEKAQKVLADVVTSQSTTDISMAGDANLKIYEALKSGKPPGCLTGFRDLDKAFSQGMARGKLWLLGGRPAMGKSALALRIARNVASGKSTPDGEPGRVLYVSLEMTDEDNQIRLISETMQLPIDDVLKLTPESERWVEFKWALDATNLGVGYEEKAKTVEAVRRAALIYKTMYRRLDLIVIDHVQLMRVNGQQVGDDTSALTAISRGLKALAKDVAPVLALSQLSREVEKRKDKRPLLTDMRQSGALEEDADVVLAMYREHYYTKQAKDENLCEVLIRKNRQGPINDVKLFFKPELTAFYDMQWEDKTTVDETEVTPHYASEL